MKRFYACLLAGFILCTILCACENNSSVDEYSYNNSVYGNDYVSNKDSNSYKNENDLSNSKKKEICNYIQQRYDYYDTINGGYAGDKYSDIIMHEAAVKYGITDEEAFEIWCNMYSY